MQARGGPRPAPGTLTALFFDAVDRFDKPDALQVKVDGHYRPISHREMERRVRHVARGLAELGVHPGDRVAILSENRPEWAIADLACLTARMADVPIYPTLPAQQAAYILRDCGAVAIFVSTRAQARKMAEVRTDLASLRHVIAFDEGAVPADLTLSELERRGAAGETPDATREHRAAAAAVRPGDLATIIYTSGTTGDPKGVMLTHDNIHSNVVAGRAAIPFAGSDVALSFLPLSHIFERMAGHYLMLSTGTSIAYAESAGTVAANLLEVRPTLVLSVPRLYEKMYTRILANAAGGGALRQRMFAWARSVGERWTDTTLAGRPVSRALTLSYRLASRLVFSRLRERTGGRLRYFVSGGAPLSREINRFFHSAGLTILEGYGLTETSPLIAVNTPGAFRIGTVGRPADGVEVRIADDGEICTRGPHVMKGYFNRPDATTEVMDADGWFHTGDVGTLSDGFVSITDRKKDIIVTASGKNIAPQPIENRVRANRFVAQAVVIGDRRKYPTLLVVPNFDTLEKWAGERGMIWADRASLLQLKEVVAKMSSEALGTLGGLAEFEVPRKVALLAEDFSIERGELTPTLKVKRRAIDANYRAVIDALYAG